MYTAVKTIFSVIHRIPDQLLRWIGCGDQLGEFAQQHVEGSKAMGVAVGAALGSSMQNLRGSLQQGYANISGDKNQRKQAEQAAQSALSQNENSINQLRGQSGKDVHDSLISGIKGSSTDKSTVSGAFTEMMNDLQNNSVGKTNAAGNFEEKVKSAIGSGSLSSNSLTAVSQLNNLANQAKQEGIAKFGNDLSNDLPNLGTQLVSNMSIANATSTARNFAEVLGQNSKVTDSVKSLVNKGDFAGALNKLNDGGSAGNPEGSTPNAGQNNKPE